MKIKLVIWLLLITWVASCGEYKRGTPTGLQMLNGRDMALPYNK